MCGGGGGWRGGSGSSGGSGDGDESPPISPQGTEEDETVDDPEGDSNDEADSPTGPGATPPTGGGETESDIGEDTDRNGTEDPDVDQDEDSDQENGDETEPEDDSDDIEEENCYVDETTDLEATNPDALDAADLGGVYHVELRKGRPCVIDDQNRVIGSILGDFGETLLVCMGAGYQYRAEILEISGRNCSIQVTNKCWIDSSALISSPNPDRLDSISEGQVLDLVVRDGSLCLLDKEGRVVGSIVRPWSSVIAECIEKNNVEYIAEVGDIDGGACEVLITNRPPEE